MKINIIITALILAVMAIVLTATSITCIPAGNIGVVTAFGKVEKEVIGEGINWVAFYKRVHRMSIQTQEEKETAEVPSKEGLIFTVECSLLYSLQKERGGEIYQTIGENYVNVVVQPQFRSALRGVTVNYEAKSLYTSGREEIEYKLLEMTRALIEPRGIKCEKVLLRAMTLPDKVKGAIENKLSAEQEAQQMQFVLQKEKLEAERKSVEAGGIASAQKIIDGTLTDNYLRFLWIQGINEAGKNPSTVIYIPMGNDGLPIYAPVRGDPINKK
ncbi:MAG: prohibitin family protein [Planctomycetota bacterium]